jgi:hypothetical protein
MFSSDFETAQQEFANSGQQEQCEGRRRDEAADHHGGKRSLNLSENLHCSRPQTHPESSTRRPCPAQSRVATTDQTATGPNRTGVIGRHRYRAPRGPLSTFSRNRPGCASCVRPPAIRLGAFRRDTNWHRASRRGRSRSRASVSNCN